MPLLEEEKPKSLAELSAQAGLNIADVQAEQAKYPGLTREAAMGSVAMRRPVPMLTTDNAVKTVDAGKQKLDAFAPILPPEKPQEVKADLVALE